MSYVPAGRSNVEPPDPDPLYRFAFIPLVTFIAVVVVIGLVYVACSTERPDPTLATTSGP